MLIQHNAIQQFLGQTSDNELDFYNLLQLQQKSLLLCLNALSQLNASQAVIILPDENIKRKRTKGHVNFKQKH